MDEADTTVVRSGTGEPPGESEPTQRAVGAPRADGRATRRDGRGAVGRDHSTARRATSRDLSLAGLLSAGIFFALSLFPSLLPRTSITQGIISGVTLAIGYGLGALVHWTWDYVGLPRTTGRTRRVVTGIMWALVGFVIASATWQHVGWQNEVRGLMGMPPTAPTLWPTLLAVALVLAVLLVIVGRSVRLLFLALVRRLGRWLSRRQARLAGVAILGLVAWGLWTGVIVNGFFTAANQIFAPRDTATNDGVTAPTSSLRSGGPDSLVSFSSLGRQGRNFVGTGPTVEELDDFHGGGALEPIRVYVGLKSAPTLEARADLVLQELRRTGAFEREVLVVATTTGTGFLDPQGVDPLEWLHNGDTAIAGAQYSYLPSWISLLADQAEVQNTSRTVFETVNEYWRSLPEDDRPELYLYGLSLGSFGVESVLASVNLVNEPIDGALMVGPPFVNDLHAQLEASRDEGSPAWLPIVDDGRTVRFMAHATDPAAPAGGGAEWGPTRLLYLQHASDPVVNFSTDLAWREPDWLGDGEGERGPEIADDFVWVPLVTMWQALVDLPEAGGVPEGYGHLYSGADNARAWASISRPDDWSEADMAALQDVMDAQPPA